ncbi:MAG: caspase family protein, partial [Nitrospirae bacterium]|nr:caspase family protein [Nitrospirota bacterium]
LPVDADSDKLKRTGVVFSEIKTTIASLAGKTIMFVDTCYSGNVMGTRRGVADIDAVVNELSSAENGAIVFAASTGKQYSLEDASWGNGAFTKALVEGLSGKADYTGKGRITLNMLDLYVSERVKELTKGKQTPTTTKPVITVDFPIAIRK